MTKFTFVWALFCFIIWVPDNIISFLMVGSPPQKQTLCGAKLAISYSKIMSSPSVSSAFPERIDPL